jgi:hypothetical protein
MICLPDGVRDSNPGMLLQRQLSYLEELAGVVTSMKLSTTLRRLIRVLPALGVLLICAHPSTVLCQSGFGSIAIGANPRQLPISCTGGVYCEGIYQSSWVRVRSFEGTVSGVEVIYSGDTLISGRAPIVSSPITLAQAIKTHSFQKGFKAPRFGYAKGEPGAYGKADGVYGIIDFVNMIVYHTPNTKSTSSVDTVYYASSDAPLLVDAKRLELPASVSARLIADATGAQTYTNKVPLGSVEEPSPAVAEAESHRYAVDGLQARVDVVIGSGRMLLALIDQVSTWYTVDRDNPTALQKAEEIRTMYPKFITAYGEIPDYIHANESWLTMEDLDNVPVDLLDKVASKLRQLEAMGFSQ